MKITKVKWDNHPILGDLELDLTNTGNNKTFDNVLFVGENGCGKTTILKSISTFLNIGSFKDFEYIEYSINNKVYQAVQTNEPTNRNYEGYHSRIDVEQGSVSYVYSNKSNRPHEIQENNLDIRHYGCVFSKARADYHTGKIQSTTFQDLDTQKYDNDKDENFTSLKQLIVDIEHQDNHDFTERNKIANLSWADFYPLSKIYRFKNAFNSFFENLKYKNTRILDQEMHVFFEKNGTDISIDNLSTGEKQIVFRGSFLLKNLKKLENSIVMIDEPEISMHPKWQKKILDFYKNLFIDNTVQKTQLFFATHSELVLRNALGNKNNHLVIILKCENGVITSKRVDTPTILPSITDAETNYIAFDMPSNDFHIELYGYLQQKNALTSVKATDDYIKQHPKYVATDHNKQSSNPHGTTYDTLSTYIRNAIDHPNPAQTFTEIELRKSIELLVELCI
ncbi:AAA family ATPase [Chryseobacterium limigenitum]|uniref:Predicted ATP-binding protein involved in virulence n=1 Tax=Chryseobacterium limigenitum TaxID=1612149 RepID=A0A1K2IIC0_9FLAO|nr:ATP-binding protein [Chryseobacterium limigenitum]SFZ92018.1 Predicted ATP-binding protein involved in virulence [Chryseobacterium limigenitum]